MAKNTKQNEKLPALANLDGAVEAIKKQMARATAAEIVSTLALPAAASYWLEFTQAGDMVTAGEISEYGRNQHGDGVWMKLIREMYRDRDN